MKEQKSRNFDVYVGQNPSENKAVIAGIQQFAPIFTREEQEEHFKLAYNMHETKSFNGRKLKQNTIMTDPRKQQKGWLGFRYPHHEFTQKLRQKKQEGLIPEILKFINWEVDSIESIPEVQNMIDALKRHGIIKSGMSGHFQVGFNVYNVSLDRVNGSKIGGLGFHEDKNFDEEDILIYSLNNDAQLKFMPRSRCGDHCLFSIDLPAGTVTRFEAGTLCRVLTHGVMDGDIAGVRACWIIRMISNDDAEKAAAHKQTQLDAGKVEKFW